MGFGRAVGLRREAWDRIVQGDDLDAAACANLMRVMYAFVKGESDLSSEVAEELDRKAPRMIREAVVDLNAWTKPPRCGAGRPGGAARVVGAGTMDWERTACGCAGKSNSKP